MTNVIRMKKGNVFTFSHQLKWTDGSPIDLTVAVEVKLKVKMDDELEYIVDDVMDIWDPEDGIVQRMWKLDEVEVPGMYAVEFVVRFSDGSLITVPSGEMLWLWIMEGL